MPDTDAKEPECPHRLTFCQRRNNGRSIQRHIERRFDGLLSELAGGDPEAVRRLPHVRWLLDNSHLVRQALQQIKTDLPATFLRELPSVRTPDKRQIPRIFALIDKAIDQTGLPVDGVAIERLCTHYRSDSGPATRLTLGELWAVPTALRITLLTRLCEATERAPAVTEPEPALTDDDPNTTVIAGCITSIRTVSTLDWSGFVERASVVERTLRQDPAKVYTQMDFETRDHYRRALEQIALRTHLEQWQVADAVVKLARSAAQEDSAKYRQHVGYYLIDKGRPALERAIHYRAGIADHLRNHLQQHTAGVYLSTIIGLAAWGAAALYLGLRADNTGPAVSVLAALIALIPLLSVSSGAINAIVSLIIPPRHLPKIDLSEGIGEQQQAMVVVPMLLSSEAEISENLATLEHNYLGNTDPQLHFALLSDFTDADEAESPHDQRLLQHAIAGIDALNARYAVDGKLPFLLFHRRRLWNEHSQRWMGWERKRGKLEEFNNLLRGATDTSFNLQHGADDIDFAQVRYVITLDADSYIPTGTAARLIGTLAHPLNQPRFDKTGQHVVGGYTVLQPRLETNPVTGTQTRFARIFAGDVMLDLYTHAVSDIYQDLFGEAVFAGKGIYDLDAFRRSVTAQVPANTVLSHDMLEGLLGRAGLASDIVLLENYPSNYLAYLKRLHRWIRGDWQLLPWVTNPTKLGSRPFKPGLIGRWKLWDNLRRSLVTPAILALLILGWFWLPGNPLVWTLVFALFPGLPILLRIGLAFRTSLWRWGTIKSSAHNLVEHAGADAGRWLLALVFLPAEAYVVADAVLRTLYRVTVSHRRMLEWSTAAEVDRSVGNRGNAARYWRNLWFGPAAAVLIGPAVVVLNPHALPAAALFLFFWTLSPWIAHRLGRPTKIQPPVRLSESDARLVHRIARDTWRFFERFVGPETAWLPPDNVQEYPQLTIAERTSPTNIGMMLLSTLTAYDLGYLGHRQLLSRLSNPLQTLQRLEKHRGHLFNWYSTRDQRPLEPRYVSTVDSGNLVAALIAVQQTLTELPHKAHSVNRTIQALSDELTALRHQLFIDKPQKPEGAVSELIRQFELAQTLLSSTEHPLVVAHQLDQQHCGAIEDAFLHALEDDPNRWSAEEIAHFRENDKVFRQRIRMILSNIAQLAPWSEHLSKSPALLSEPEYRPSFESLSQLLDVAGDAHEQQKRLDAAADLIMTLMAKLSADQPGDRTTEKASLWLDRLQHEINRARTVVRELDESRQGLIQVITTLISATDFTFLYDPTRNLFRVGYNASTGEADSSYYDLLASEARIASFVAIAKGDIPAKHWMHLGRPLTRIRGLRILLSWSATAFEQGDVLHWWHELPLRGVRTRCSDDLLWLAYAVTDYVDATDDTSILTDSTPFLQGEPLDEHELERYAEFQPTEHTASIYDHCCRAIDARIAFGEHGLPFIGTGDWNDSLNRIGEKGRGESVWMAWFLIIVCRRFAPLCRQMDDNGRADHYETIAADLLRHTQTTAFADKWYLRGYFDDGTPLGAPGDAESAIDLNAQTWAILADADDPNVLPAMQAVDEHLIDTEHRLIKLLAPPFEKTAHDPGYIRSYPPGVRENGGQYTHAAVWAAWAATVMGDQERAMRWFEWLNPLKRGRSEEEIQHYRLEPYVTAGDIYGVGSLAGRGGWSWYTGSASWLYRLAIRQLLGLQRKGQQLFVRPCLPDSWPLFEATLRYEEATYDLRVHHPARIAHDALFILNNREPSDVACIELASQGHHKIEIFASDTARRRWLTENSQPKTENTRDGHDHQHSSQ